jgi:RimJ/RimL family protein N-acetyltransferase
MSLPLTAARLRLVPIPHSCTIVKPEEREPIARAVAARVPESWPVENYDQEMLDWVRATLEKNPDEEYGAYYIVIDDPEPTVIGTAGSQPPDDDGAVVAGYSVLPEFRRRGYASESLMAIIDFARRDPRAKAIVAFTFPHLIPSIKTMEKCGLRFTGAGAEEGTIRYALAL